MVSTGLYKAVLQNDYTMVKYYLGHTPVEALKKIYIALKYSNFDLYLDYIRLAAREKVNVQIARVLLMKLKLPADMCLNISTYI